MQYQRRIDTTLTARRRAILKLREGVSLDEEEMATVLPEEKENAAKCHPRSLSQVGKCFGLSRERIRQLEEISRRILDGGVTARAGYAHMIL